MVPYALVGCGSQHLGNWAGSFDHNNRWNLCPGVTAVMGLNRSGGDKLYNIDYAKCAYGKTPRGKQISFNECYDESYIGGCLDHNNRWCNCKNGYFVAGFFRGGGDKVYHIERYRCCRPNSSQRHPLSAYWNWVSYNNSDGRFGGCFDRSNWCYTLSNYFMVGFYRGGGDRIYHLERMSQAKIYVRD